MKPSKTRRDLQIRLIQPADNRAVAAIIRLVMTEFKAMGCGKHGFKILEEPMGDTGYSSCETWMARDL